MKERMKAATARKYICIYIFIYINYLLEIPWLLLFFFLAWDVELYRTMEHYLEPVAYPGIVPDTHTGDTNTTAFILEKIWTQIFFQGEKTPFFLSQL